MNVAELQTKRENGKVAYIAQSLWGLMLYDLGRQEDSGYWVAAEFQVSTLQLPSTL